MMTPRTIALLAALALPLLACPGPDSGDSDSGTSTTQASTDASESDSTTTTATTASPTTGAPAGPECQQDGDCVLVNNCCECDAKPVDAEVAACEGNCLQSTCEARSLGGVTAACRSGVCEFANVQCMGVQVDCDQPEPSCPEGTTISVIAGCWGPCVPPRYCDGAACSGTSCGDGWMCVDSQSGASTCAVTPRECGGEPTCDCASPYLDEFCSGGCFEDTGGLVCEDGG